ncbi:MAG: hypothetical protein LBT14_13610 [Treponema sp.]|jgi:hypothetical protein|nr:hypothetical protein [Treponema sp.]
MAEYTIALSKKHLKLLMEHVFIGRWILTSNHPEKDKLKEYDDFYDTVLSLLKNYHIVDEIEYAEESGYELTDDKFDELSVEINTFNNDVFFDELVSRLGERDALEKYGTDAFFTLPPEERFTRRIQEEEKYNKEFEEIGIQNLRIQKKR